MKDKIHPYFLSLKPILILRKLLIEKDNMALFSSSHNDYVYKDFEYEHDELENNIDGYEVNILNLENYNNPYKNSQISDYIEKKFLDVLFIGDRVAGDIGYLIEQKTENGVLFTCSFSQEAHDEYYPIFIKFYEEYKDYTATPETKELLYRRNRDKKIDNIIKNNYGKC